MRANEKILAVDAGSVQLVYYPDPRLQKVCTPIDVVDDAVRTLVERMHDLMFAHKGVGLAAPQVGVTVRLFVASPTFELDDFRVLINPRIVSSAGTQDGDEGCLSFPDISCKIKRAAKVTVEALNQEGEAFTVEVEDLAARIFQHEIDHLDGRLLVDRMGSMAKLANRRALRDLEERFSRA